MHHLLEEVESSVFKVCRNYISDTAGLEATLEDDGHADGNHGQTLHDVGQDGCFQTAL